MIDGDPDCSKVVRVRGSPETPQYNIDNYRLLLLLGLADMLHLLTSLLSFSLPTLSSTFLSHTYLHSLPYTLPLAQVFINAKNVVVLLLNNSMGSCYIFIKQ